MSRNWQKIDFQRDWAGLVARTQTLDFGPDMASQNQNVEYYGGAIAKRLGSQYLNGWGTRTVDGWTNSGNATGDVLDGSGLVNGDVATFYFPDGSNETKTITTVTSNTLVLSGVFTGTPTAGMAVIVRRALNSGARIDGLFQANFRDGTRKLLAAAGNTIYEVPALGAGLGGTVVPTSLPATTVDVTWGGLATGTLTSIEGVTNGDKIVIAGAGTGGGDHETAVASLTLLTRTIVINPPAVSAPQATAAVSLFPKRVAADTHFAQFNNMTHIVSDSTPPVKYLSVAGTYTIQMHGIKAPTHAGTLPTATDGGAGLLSAGNYSYRYKFKNSATGAESEAGPEVTIVGLAASHQVNLTLPVSVDPQVDKLRIYRSLPYTGVVSPGIWYFQSEVSNGTTNTTDNLPDASLGTLMREFLDNQIPTDTSVIALWPHANRMLAIRSGNGAVIFSDQANLEDGSLKGESWPVDNFLLVNFDDGDKPRAVMAFFDSVLMFKERSIFRLQGLPPNLSVQPLLFRQDLTGIGAFNQKAIVVDKNEMLFPGEDGVYLVDRFAGDRTGFQSSRISRQIDNVFNTLNRSQQQKVHAVFFRERRQYRAFVPLGVEPDTAYVYQFEGNIEGQPYGWSNWTFSEGADNGIQVTASAVARGEPDVQYVGTSTGDVLQMDVGAAERGGFPYTFAYATTLFAPAGKGLPARGRALDLVASVFTDTTLQPSIEADFAGGIVAANIPLIASTGFILDSATFGILGQNILRSGGSSGSLEQAASVLVRALGEYHRIKLHENSAVARFNLQNWSYWFQALPQQAKRRVYRQAV